jgi:hypothetical protein
MSLPTEMLSLIYDEGQHKRFRAGGLAHEWRERYPMLFDNQDLKIALYRPSYHFFEWLTAIILYESMGWLSLVEQYEFKSHRTKQAKLTALVSHGGMSQDMLKLILKHEDYGNTQCPDLLVFAPDYSQWFFCEAKGPRDSFSENQLKFFKELETTSDSQLRVVRFKHNPQKS